MASNLKLNLVGILSPICLLKCKSVLAQMNCGDILEISLQDPDVVEELTKIIERSPDRLIKTGKKQEDYLIHIKKG